MFSRTKYTWRIVARMMKHYSKTTVNQLSSEQQAPTNFGIQIRTPILSAISLRNPSTVLRNVGSTKNEDEENNPFTMSKAFGFASVVSILMGEKDDEKNELGEEQIVHMIKLARLSQEVNSFWFAISFLLNILFNFILMLTEERVQKS
jgi:hypothetical protein